MSATTPYLQVDGELACASCGRTLLLGERYEPGPHGNARCELCRWEPTPPAEPATPPNARDRIRLAWLVLIGDADGAVEQHGARHHLGRSGLPQQPQPVQGERRLDP